MRVTDGLPSSHSGNDDLLSILSRDLNPEHDLKL